MHVNSGLNRDRDRENGWGQMGKGRESGKWGRVTGLLGTDVLRRVAARE